MKYTKVIAIMSLSFLALLFSSFDAFDYDKAWKNVEQFIEKGLPKSALEEVHKIYDNAIKENNIAQQIKAVSHKVQLILQTEELGLETVVSEIEESIEKAKMPGKQILHSMAGELMNQYFKSQYYIISQRTNLNSFETGDIRTWTPNNYRDYISAQYLASIDKKLNDYPISDYKDIILNIKNSDLSLRPSLYELLLDRALNYFSNTSTQGTKPSFTFKINDSRFFLPVEEFVKFKIETEDKESKLYQALLLFQEGLKLPLENNNLKVLADYDLKRLDFVNQHAEISKPNELYINALTSAASYYKEGLSHPFQIKIGLDLRTKKKYQEAINVFNTILNESPSDYAKSEATRWINTIKTKSLSIQSEQVIPLDDNFLLNISSRNIDNVCFKLLDASKVDFANLFSGQRQDQKTKIEALTTLRKWDVKDIQDGYNFSSFENIMEGLPHGKYIVVASDTEEFKSENSAYVFTAFFVSDIAHSTYDLFEGKKVSVRNRKSGKPLMNALIEVYARSYNRDLRRYQLNLLTSKRTDKDGFALFKVESNNSISYKIKYENDLLDLEQFDYNSRLRKRDYQSLRSEIFTDRAIYRPGQTVHFKTLSMKIDDEGVPSIHPNSKLSIVLNDANGQEVEKLTLKSNEFGSTSGSFILPTGRLTGSFSISVHNESYTNSTRFSVEEYKRPKFEVTLKDVEEEIKLGDEIVINGNAKALSGAPVSNSKVSYVITRETYYGWWSWYRRVPNQSTQITRGELSTEDNGDFSFKFEAQPDDNLDPSKNPTYNYSVQVDVTDLAGETRSATKSVSVAVFPYSYAWNLKEVMDITELASVNISPTTSENKKVSAKGVLVISELEQPKTWRKPRVWKSPSNPQYKRDEFEKRIDRIGYKKSVMSEYPIKSEILRLDVEYGKEGMNYDFDKVLIAGRAYKIELISDEEYRGLKIQDTKYVAVTSFKQNSFPNINLLYADGQKEMAQVGKKHEVAVGTSDKELTAYYQVVRDWEILKEGFIDLTNHNKISYTPSERERGGYSIVVDYVKHNFSATVKYDINLPWDNKKLNVELVTKRDKVLPGSKEEWMLKISGPDKDKKAAELLATMYDASLDQFVSHSYSFNPYLSHYGYIQGRFFGFNQGVNGNLNYGWARTNFRGTSSPGVPRLGGIFLNGRYAGVSISPETRKRTMVRGSAPMSKESDLAAETFEGAAPEAMMMMDEETESMAGNSSDSDDNGIQNASQSENNTKVISVRKNLDESVFFYPHLKTDAEGNIILSFTMNEALTNWKLLTFAHDKDLRFGMTSHEVKTQKDVMIVPNAPRFLREGDRLIFPATITNLSEKSISASASLELIDPSNDEKLNVRFGLEKTNKKLDVSKGESKRVDWEIQIPKDYKGLVKYRVVASAGKHTDGEENILPIVTNQTLVTETKVISLKKKEKKSFQFDAMERTSSSTSVPFKYTLEYTSNPVWYAVQALPYLMEYPHNCTEQIFNRMYANTMASHIANQSPKIKAVFDQWKALDSDALISNLEKNESLKSAILEETPWVRQAKSETEQKKRIALLFDLNKMSSETKQVLEELKNRQMASGAFPWFKGGREDVYITQNVVEGIAHLNHLGIISSDDYEYMNIVDRALVYLDEQSKKRYDRILKNIKQYGGNLEDDHLSNISIHYLYIRSFFKDKQVGSGSQKAYDYFMSQAEKYWLGKGLYSEAMIGLTLKRDKNSTYEQIIASHKERSFYSEELGRYWNLGSGFNWYELPIETHAMLIEFFTEAEKDDAFVEDMKIWLLKNKQTNHWKTTKGTAAAIYSLLIQGEETGMITWIEEDNLPDIQMSGKPLFIDKSNTEVGTGYFQKSWSGSDITNELSEITIDNKNETIAWGAAYYQYFEDLDKVKDFKETPLKMSRKLFKEVKTDRDPELIEINDQSKIEPGDRIIARIEIKVDRSMSYVHLKDMRGSGFEPENVLSGYRWKGGLGYYESTRDLASHFFISQLNKGTYVFEYPMRAVHKGEFSTGIATLQCMYAPEFTSHSEGGRVEVR